MHIHTSTPPADILLLAGGLAFFPGFSRFIAGGACIFDIVTLFQNSVN
jgi:hypothetical protein